jgi:enoyl-CoA hydratase
VCGDNAKLGATEILSALIPGGGGCLRLARAVGASRAKELVFSGRFVGAEEALELGLVDELVAPDGVYDAALAWAGRFADTSTAAIALAKTLVDAFTDTELDADTQTRRYGEVFDAAGGQLGCAL